MGCQIGDSNVRVRGLQQKVARGLMTALGMQWQTRVGTVDGIVVRLRLTYATASHSGIEGSSAGLRVQEGLGLKKLWRSGEGSKKIGSPLTMVTVIVSGKVIS